MARGRVSASASMQQCPPGFLCMSDTLFIALVIIAAIGIGILLYMRDSLAQQKTVIVHAPQPQPQPQPPQAPTLIDNRIVGDLRFSRAPQPLRDWMAPPELPPRGGLATIPINIPTQGLPESFQMVGNINSGGQMLPIYGRRTNGSSDRWNYYTRTDTFNPVPLPIRYQKRDCMDDVGCQELLGGEEIKIEGTGQQGNVRMYKYDGPKYIPGLL